VDKTAYPDKPDANSGDGFVVVCSPTQKNIPRNNRLNSRPALDGSTSNNDTLCIT